MADEGKLAGKTEWAGRRRPATRRAGYSVQAAVEIDKEHVTSIRLDAGASVSVRFSIPAVRMGDWLGFGGWFTKDDHIHASVRFDRKYVLTEYLSPNWNKIGSLWVASDSAALVVDLVFNALRPGTIALYGMQSGRVEHEYLTTARPAILKNMWQFAPEANFYEPTSAKPALVTNSHAPVEGSDPAMLALKSCNRCGRFLPINLQDERAHLSYSNHCVAVHRRPCSHAGFGRILAKDSGDRVQLEYGYQLECRFCKKFEVNAAHNPQRSAGQMKEDGTRRRHFELLLEQLYEASPQLQYRSLMQSDLATDVWNKFDRQCFKCGTLLGTANEMHLDHTRPLALLWPLDGSATALCATHNSEKRDRFPSEFYSEVELRLLSTITRIPYSELIDPSPNMDAVRLLGLRIDWFYDTFLQLPALQRVHDGKRSADLLVKALQKTLNRCPGGAPYKLR